MSCLCRGINNHKQDRQCTYNLTLMHIHAAFVAIGKSVSITYSMSAFVVLGIKHVMQLCHIVCDLSGSMVYFHIIS